MSPTLKSGGKRPARPRRPGLTRAERERLIADLRRDAERIAGRFRLRYRAIEAESARVKRRYGCCDTEGVIKIRLTHAKTGRPLKYSSLVATLCHELAHLEHFHHGPSFRDFYDVILDWARREGIYRPGSRPARPSAVKTPAPGATRYAAAPAIAAVAQAAVGNPRTTAVARRAAAPPAAEPEQLRLI